MARFWERGLCSAKDNGGDYRWILNKMLSKKFGEYIYMYPPFC